MLIAGQEHAMQAGKDGSTGAGGSSGGGGTGSSLRQKLGSLLLSLGTRAAATQGSDDHRREEQAASLSGSALKVLRKTSRLSLCNKRSPTGVGSYCAPATASPCAEGSPRHCR